MNYLIIPGHNSHADKPRFVALKGALENTTVFDARRKEHVPGEELALTVSEEYEQVVALAKTLPKPLTAIGHSQGGALALRLGYEQLVDGVVCLMGDTSSQDDVNHLLATLGTELHEIREKGFVRYERDSGQANWYSADFFEDYLMWNIFIYATSEVPKLFVAGKQDVFNTPAKIKELFEEAAEPKRYVEIDSEHSFEEEHVQEISIHIKEFTQ